MDIKWKKGSRCVGDAVKVYKELETIRKREKGLKPESIVKKAKSKRSALHNNFTWDDTEAANSHRIAQARYIIRSIEVVYEEAPKVQARMYEITTAPAKDGEEPHNIYQSTKELLEDPIARDELLSRAIREALSYRKKYHGLSELSKVFQAMDGFVENADELLAK